MVSASATEFEIEEAPPLAEPDTGLPPPLATNQASQEPRRAPRFGSAAAPPSAEGEPDSASSPTTPLEAEGEDEATDGTAVAKPRRLGLAQLGLLGPNPFLDRDSALGPPRPAPRSRTARKRDVKQRVEADLAQALQDRDTSLGLGAGGPVMRTLESVVYGSSVPLNGNAIFSFVIDGSGKLVSSSLGHVSSERDKWERVARDAAQRLANQELRVPRGRGVKLTIAVTSHLELPSGRDPGVEVRALGIPLKKGQGPNSTRLDLLNPVSSSILALDGDPADIGAKARRMVRSHVVSEELL